MKEYKSVDSFEIDNVGKVLIVINDEERDRSSLTGSTVLIDNVSYKVRGVESYGLPKIRKGDFMGILIDKL